LILKLKVPDDQIRRRVHELVIPVALSAAAGDIFYANRGESANATSTNKTPKPCT